MSLKSRTGPARRLTQAAAALLLATLLTVTSSNLAQAQAADVSIVNSDRQIVERKKEGDFVARPVFDREVETLYYGIRNPDTGDWLTHMYRVKGGGKRLREGWEYTFEYPAFDRHPDLDPERAYLLVLLVNDPGGESVAFYAVIPVHRPGGLWDRVLGALEPGRWAKAFARWVIEGTHGTLCGVVERASGADAANCRGG